MNRNKKAVARSMNFHQSTTERSNGSGNVLERNGIFSGSTKRSDKFESGSDSVFERKKQSHRYQLQPIQSYVDDAVIKKEVHL
jgi:hypothetical protein